MPKAKNESTSNKVKSTSESVDMNIDTDTVIVPTASVGEDDVNELRTQVNELSSQLAQALELLKASAAVNPVEPIAATESNVVESDLEFEQPHPHKQIRVMSLYFGTLNLRNGQGAKYKFNKYGEIKPMLYDDLIKVINHNRKFAESGYFYILDKAAIYHLGLTEPYENIVGKEVVDNILNYSDVEIHDIFSNIEKRQADNIYRLLCDLFYNLGPKVDYNKVEIIGKSMGRNMRKDLEEMIEHNPSKNS